MQVGWDVVAIPAAFFVRSTTAALASCADCVYDGSPMLCLRLLCRCFQAAQLPKGGSLRAIVRTSDVDDRLTSHSNDIHQHLEPLTSHATNTSLSTTADRPHYPFDLRPPRDEAPCPPPPSIRATKALKPTTQHEARRKRIQRLDMVRTRLTRSLSLPRAITKEYLSIQQYRNLHFRHHNPKRHRRYNNTTPLPLLPNILMYIAGMFAANHHSLVGSHEDPPDGGKVAVAVFSAVAIYGVRLAQTGRQRENVLD